MLDDAKAEVKRLRQSKKDPMGDEDVSTLLSSVDEVVLARGKSVRRVRAGDVGLEDLKGPTGGYRAPMVKLGRRLLVGFHDETLRKLLG